MDRIKTKGKTHSYYLVGEGGERTFVGKFKYNKDGLIKLPSSFSAKDGQGNSFGFEVTKGNEERAYIRGDAMGSLLGALAETNTSDLSINGFSLSDGRSPDPSVSHKDGKNGDLRYLSENENGERVILGQRNLDMDRQNNLNDALYKFGWKDMISEKFKPAGSTQSTLLDHTSSATARGIPSNHTNHLHLQGYSPRVRTLYNGGELQSVTVTAKRNQ